MAVGRFAAALRRVSGPAGASSPLASLLSDRPPSTTTTTTTRRPDHIPPPSIPSSIVTTEHLRAPRSHTHPAVAHIGPAEGASARRGSPGAAIASGSPTDFARLLRGRGGSRRPDAGHTPSPTCQEPPSPPRGSCPPCCTESRVVFFAEAAPRHHRRLLLPLFGPRPARDTAWRSDSPFHPSLHSDTNSPPATLGHTTGLEISLFLRHYDFTTPDAVLAVAPRQ